MSSYLPKPKSKQPKPEPPRKPAKPPEELLPVQPKEIPTEPPAGTDYLIPNGASEVEVGVPEQPGRTGGIPDWLKGAIASLLVAGILFAGIASYSFVRQLVGSNFRVIGVFPQPAPADDATPLPGASPTLPALAGPATKPWNGLDRVTLLAMGKDFREGWDVMGPGPARTDTMIVLSLDPVTKTAGMLSIPRDLYVDIPGYGFNRINMAYFLAERDRMPGGGPALAMQTAENLLGIPIDYYAVLDFASFTTVVDEIGGIDVYVPFDNMKIDPYGPEPVKLLFFGDNHLSGSEALAFARARYTEGGDIDRAARTQQVIIAIRDKILNLGMLPTLIAKAPTLYNQISTGVDTNLTLDQILSLAMIAKDVPRGDIRQGVIDNEILLRDGYVSLVVADGRQDVLIPDLAKVRELRDRVFTSIGPLGYENPPADLTALALEENPKIRILNGSGRDGLAGATRQWLVKLGYADANIETGTAESQIPSTQITDLSGVPYTVRWLSELMNRSYADLVTQVSMDGGVDLQIILGADWAVPEEE
jgi:LCP family protein required for cell wall assembly